MEEDVKNVIPIRQMSSRKSKPSIDLLVDHQRPMSSRTSKPSMDRLVDSQKVLSPFVIPKKKPPTVVLKNNLNKRRSENPSESALVDNTVKLRRESLRGQDITTYTNKLKTATIIPTFPKKRRSIPLKRKISSHVINESNSLSFSEIETKLLANLPYVTLKLNKIDVPKKLITEDNNGDTNEDDIPLSKVFPDLKSPDITDVSVKCEDIGLVRPKKTKVKRPLPVVTVSNGIHSPKSTSSNNNDSVSAMTDSIVRNGAVKKARRTRGTTQNEAMKAESKEAEVTDSRNDSLPVLMERPPQCARDKCTNVAIEDFRWDKEFCSVECAMGHSKSWFSAWLADRRTRLQMRI